MLRQLLLDSVRFFGKSEKGFEKQFLQAAVLACARVISKKKTNPFLDFQSNGKKEIHEIRIWISLLKSTLRMDFSKVKSVFGFRVRLQNPKSQFSKSNRDLLIKTKETKTGMR